MKSFIELFDTCFDSYIDVNSGFSEKIRCLTRLIKKIPTDESSRYLVEELNELLLFIDSRLVYKNSSNNEEDYKSKLIKLLNIHYSPIDTSFLESELSFIQRGSHGRKRDIDESFKNGRLEKLTSELLGLKLHWFFEDMGRNLTFCFNKDHLNDEMNILVIDDNYSGILEKRYTSVFEILEYKLKEIHCEIFKTFRSVKKIDKEEDIVKIAKLKSHKEIIEKIHNTINFDIKNIRYIFIDLLIGNELLGHEIIKKLSEIRDFCPEKYKYEIIVVSRSTNTEDIQNALNFGASLYIPKERIFSIPYRLYQLGTIKPQQIDYSNTFRSLIKLSPAVIKKLQTETISYKENKEENYRWISRFPKADLHYHLGGGMDADLTLRLSMYIAFETINNNSIKKHYDIDSPQFCCEDSDIKNNNKGYIFNKKYQKVKSPENSVNLSRMLSEIKVQAELYRKYATKLKNKKKPVDLKQIQSPEKFFQYISDNYYPIKPYQVTAIFNCFLSLDKIDNDENILDNFLKGKFNSDKLRLLIQATHGKNIDEAVGGISLQSFLKGCDYTGGDVIQSKLTMKEAICDLCKKAEKSNILYLSVRMTPTSFTKGGLSQDEVWQAIKDGYDKYLKGSDSSYKLILTIIIALKRHSKKETEIKENIAFGIKYYINSKGISKNFDLKNTVKIKRIFPCVIGFDLTGLESEFNPGKFRQDFVEVFNNCIPVTIHAGEETEAKYIWEAAYELNADRVGHGLSLVDDPKLINRFKDFDKCVELCPTSNFLTQESYFYSKSKRKFFKSTKSKKGREYPSAYFLDNDVNFVVCTDDPAIQNSDINIEYLWLSDMTVRKKKNNQKSKDCWGITKWEALKLIRNSFKYCFLPYDLKKHLLKFVDYEVFKILDEKK